ncbi:ATP-binding protein [Natranaerobius trueperi]|uniref:Nuclease SbcCD subunit C n=1 Tax=Natranaerobius trueperi TaxID=759412 RepID=A0A226BX53_9FIRM|nr:AAA family ATPase [Natranaerobius trueperi]OWZ83535.1 hypothetical protein CDO51_07980 [Natranaerobius trueperi]
MKLKEVKLHPFGGVSEGSWDFSSNLNVIYGPNEAGKSTIINALYSVLVLGSPNRRSVEWSQYLKKFFPYPNGDIIRVSLSFNSWNDKNYYLERHWGLSKQDDNVRLISQEGELTKETSVTKKMSELLRYGKKTYESILFTRQDEINHTLKTLDNTPEATETVSETLRNFVYHQGGVSVEKFQRELEQEKKALLSNFDLDRCGPKDPNRGVNNPYLKNIGKLLQAYYRVESLKKELEKTKNMEEELSSVMEELSVLTNKQQELYKQETNMAMIEQDIRKRGELSPKLNEEELKISQLKTATFEWPKTEEKYNEKNEEIKEIDERIKELEQELIKAKEGQRIKQIKETLDKTSPLITKRNELQVKLDNYKHLSKEKIEHLDNLDRNISALKAQLAGMKLSAQFSTETPIQITVTPGYGESYTKEINDSTRFTGEGKIRLECDEWCLEVQSGEEEGEKLVKDVTERERQLNESLANLGVETIDKAKELIKTKEELNSKLQQIQTKLESLLGLDFEEKYEKLKTNLNDSETDLQEIRTVEEINDELNNKKLERQKLDSERNELKGKIEKWKAKYESHDKLFDELGELKYKERKIYQELEQLAELPEDYQSTDEFFKTLTDIRSQREEFVRKTYNLKEKRAKLERDLPEKSVEELQEELLEARKAFEKLEERARALLDIEKELQNLLTELDRETFTPLRESLNNYLSPVTNYQYELGQMEYVIPNELKKSKQDEKVPVDYLSTGTNQGLSLAIRLAMAEQILKQMSGFLIMDDPLVDLDPYRKQQAAEMLQHFSKEKQLIITTCDPQTADLLGGKLIQLL